MSCGSDFKQQKLNAWQPLLTPVWVISTLFVIGCVFLPVGIVFVMAANEVVSVEQRYDESEGPVQVDLPVPRDMEPPIFFYYKLDNFYQNHRRYKNSRDDNQLKGGEGDAAECDPLGKNQDGLMLYPCGLVANSYFNDDFSNPVIKRGVSDIPLNWTDENIALNADKAAFKQGDYDAETMTRETLGGAYMNHTKEDFMVWMRLAGLPNFLKLRYIIKDTPLKQGDVVRIAISNTYDVSAFQGTKSVVLSTASWMGGANPFLGYAYIAVAALCLLLALGFAVKYKVSEQPLGDMTHFTWVRPESAQEAKE